ncbi:hypothetical protein OG819_32545 [Streptomyces sp. NBC_01549]|nr:hypothetical protein [Streptomyces sp. NBC_01549]
MSLTESRHDRSPGLAASEPGRSHRLLPPSAAFAGSAAVFASLYVAAGAPTPLLVVFEQQWHFPAWVLTVAFASYALGLLAALLVAGSLSDHAPPAGHSGDQLEPAAVLVGVSRSTDSGHRGAGVCDFADEGSAAQQPQGDRPSRMADNIADELAGDEFGSHDQLIQVPGGELGSDMRAGLTGGCGVVLQLQA